MAQLIFQTPICLTESLGMICSCFILKEQEDAVNYILLQTQLIYFHYNKEYWKIYSVDGE